MFSPVSVCTLVGSSTGLHRKLQNRFPWNLDGGWVCPSTDLITIFCGSDKGTDRGIVSLSLTFGHFNIFVDFSGKYTWSLMNEIRHIQVAGINQYKRWLFGLGRADQVQTLDSWVHLTFCQISRWSNDPLWSISTCDRMIVPNNNKVGGNFQTNSQKKKISDWISCILWCRHPQESSG